MLLGNTSYRKKQSGFTLIEVLISLALIMLIMAISVPLYQSFQIRNDLSIAINTTAHMLRRAQLLSQAVDIDSWGVYIQNGRLTLFRGPSFASRNPDFDELVELPSISLASGLSEIVFSKFSGKPQTIGTISLTSTNNEISTLNINEEGIISY